MERDERSARLRGVQGEVVASVAVRDLSPTLTPVTRVISSPPI